MIPLKDDNPTQSFPILTLSLIVVNIYIFIVPTMGSVDPSAFFEHYGLVPVELIQTPVLTYPHLFSAMFLHAGWGHLLGNMLYLWIFGNNIEDVLGKFRFILFYLICGIIASFCHIAANPDSPIPMVGASGAISGILGAYIVLFPKARVLTLVFLGIFITMIRIPAVILLTIWMLLQISSSIFSGGGGAGVAWFAHVGGFLAGMIMILPFKNKLRI
ncbi:MAG: rhomboid family intramembrane serine protease [Nitrospinales bacterium]